MEIHLVLQVVVAFSVSALLTLILTIPCVVLFGRDETKSFNPFDNWLNRKVYLPIRQKIGEDRADCFAECIQSVVVSLSDTQLVTGIAMLASSLILTEDGSLVVYHFTLISDFAWLSANTHLLSLIAIRARINRKRPVSRTHSISHADVLKCIRISLMLLLATLLLYNSYVSAFEAWDNNLNCPVKCIRPLVSSDTIGGQRLTWLIVEYVLVLTDYPVAIFCVLERPTRLFRERCRPMYKSLLDPKLSCPRRWLNRTIVGLVMFWLSDLESMIDGIVWFVLGMYWLINDRNFVKGAIFDTNTWQPVVPTLKVMPQEEWEKLGSFGFGQLVPLFLLVLPLFTAIESWNCK